MFKKQPRLASTIMCSHRVNMNKTFGKNINISNLNEFTEKNINYQLIKDEIKIFVDVSSTEIYSSKTYFTKNRFNDIYNFSKLLRTIERKL